jgi:hypothetical protein
MAPEAPVIPSMSLWGPDEVGSEGRKFGDAMRILDEIISGEISDNLINLVLSISAV